MTTTTMQTPGYYYTGLRTPAGQYETRLIHVREDGARLVGFNGEPDTSGLPLHTDKQAALEAARAEWLASLSLCGAAQHRRNQRLRSLK
jgi:hypothetical protein